MRYKVVLINSNPATNMTFKILLRTYYRNFEKFGKKEKPDAILPTMGEIKLH